jgi:hypothetical protein
MNERKLIDEIKRLVNDDVIIGYYNGTTFTDDNNNTYSNLVTNNSPIGRGFIVPYNNGWLVVVHNNNEEVRKNIIKYRRKNEIEDIKKYPVKTIFTITDYAIPKSTFYIGGDRPSKKLFELVDHYPSDAFVSNFGGNKFFSYSLYQDLDDVNKLTVNKNNSNGITYERDSSNYDYGGYYLEDFELAVYNFNELTTRDVFLKDQKISIRNLTLTEETEVKRPDDSVFGFNKSYEIETLRANGDISVSTLTRNIEIITSERFLPFVSSTYNEFENQYNYITQGHYTREFETSFGLNAPKLRGSYDRTNVQVLNSINENTYLYQATETRNIDIWEVGKDVEGGIIEWTDSYYNISGVIPNQTFVLQETVRTGSSPNPSSVTATITNGISNAIEGKPDTFPEVRYVSSLILSNGQEIVNIQLDTVYPELSRKFRKDYIEERLDNSTTTTTAFGYTVVETYEETIEWDDVLQNYVINKYYSYTGNGIGVIDEPIFDYIEVTETIESVTVSLDPIYLDTAKVIHKVSGTNTIFNGAKGEIIQEFDGELEENYGYAEYTASESQPYPGERILGKYKSYYIKRETTNNIKLLYNDIEITLNNGDFGLLDLDSSNIVVSPITKETTNFTITYTNTALRLIKNINYIDFTGEVFNGTFVMAWETDNKPCLIRGTCESNYDSNNKILLLECEVTSIKTNTPSSFEKTFMMDNGSYYAYCFRKSINVYDYLFFNKNTDNTEISGVLFPDAFTFNFENMTEILSKEILNFIPLSPILENMLLLSTRNAEFNTFESRQVIGVNLSNHTRFLYNDSLVKNKIYSVVKVEKNKAWVEQWDILDNGDVKYKKVFEVDYVPLKKAITRFGVIEEQLDIYAHNYYPS